MAREISALIDPNHPVLVPKPTPWPGEHPLDHKMRVKMWSAAKERRKAIPKHVRDFVYERDGYRCVQCGMADRLSLDHIYPWSMGGADTAINLQTLCVPCNSRKSDSVEVDA